MTYTTSDWNSIREDYLASDISYRELSRKYGVSYNKLASLASSEGWYRAKRENAEATLSREERILAISDRLLDKIEKSISEIDRCIVKNKERTKTVEYDYDTKKPLSETVEEKEDIRVIEGMIDKMGLKQLVSTLKDIKDIHLSMQSEESLDEDEEGIIVLSDVTEDSEDEDTED